MTNGTVTKTAPLTEKTDRRGTEITVCHVPWFAPGEQHKIFHASADKADLTFSGGDLNFAARVVYAESSGSGAIPDKAERDREKEAILCVLYNRIRATGFPDRRLRETFTAVASAPRRQFDSVASKTKKFLASDLSVSVNLKRSECSDLEESLAAVLKFVLQGPPSDCNYKFFFAAAQAKQGTQIGGNKFW